MTGRPAMPLVFVYGTLKRGESNHHYLAGQRFVGRARSRPAYRLFELEGFPGLVAAPRDGRSVEGEIWEVDQKCLGLLDDLEGTASGVYARLSIPLLPPHDALEVEGYLYLGSVEGRRELTGW